MNKKLELAEEKFIEHIGNLCNKFGLNNFIAQLYGVLYLSNRPLSLDELTKKMQASKGNISINIRVLERWGAVRRIWIKGSRKDFYEAELDLKKILAERIKSSFQKHMSEMSGMLNESSQLIKSATSELSDEEKDIAKVYEARLKKIDELKGLVTTALNFADKIL